MIFYFLTRTVADKHIIIGLQVIINLWYFLIYLLLPLSRRIVEQLPNHILTGLVYIKNALTMIVPILLAYIFAKGTRIFKIFVMWPIFFIFTIAVFKWGVTLFTIYPNDPASRFMYSPFAGMAVCIAWVVVSIVGRTVNGNLKTIIYIIIGLSFITANYFIVSKSSLLYIKQQELSQNIIDDIQENWTHFEKADTIVVLTNDLANTEQIIASGEHLPAILYVMFDKNVPVSIIIQEGDFLNMIRSINGKLITSWSIEKRQLLFPSGYRLDTQIGRQ
jgi:hypothetical protein